MEEYPYPVLVVGDWTDINTKTLQNKINIYFQSKKKSQGGDCNIKWSEKSCTVFFKSQEIRDQVLAKTEHSVLIETKLLKLKVSIPSSDPGNQAEEKSQEAVKTGSDVSAGGLQQSCANKSLEKKDHMLFGQAAAMHSYPDLDENQTEACEAFEDTPRSSEVVLENVRENLNRETLMLLVESVDCCFEDGYTLELILESNTAVVTFNDPNAAEKFLKECGMKKKFKDFGLKARCLEKSRSVKVENLPDQCSEDFLELYFEKHFGAVERVELLANEQAAIITLKNQQAVQRALKKKILVQKTAVNIHPYYTSLGCALYGKDRPTWTLPEPFTDKIHPAIREFIQMKGQMSSICNRMISHFCQVNMDEDEVHLSPLPALLKQKGVTQKHMDSWKKDTLDAFRNIISNFDVFEYALIPLVWSAVEKDIRSVVKDKAVLKMDFTKGCLTLAGMAKDINMLKPILEKALKEASSQMERKQNMISDSIELSPAVYFLFQEEGLRQNTLTKYPQMELVFEKHTNQLRMTGLQIEIVDTKNSILEKQLRMKVTTMEIDPSLTEFLKSVDNEEMSRDLFISKKINTVYTFEKGNLVLIASTDKTLTEAQKRLQQILTLQNLSVEDLNVLEKPEWKDLINEMHESYNLLKKKTVQIKFLRNRDSVVVCGFQEPVKEISSKLKQFIDKYSRIEEKVRVQSYAVVKFIKDKMPHVWQKFLKGDELNINFDSRRPLIRVSGERIQVKPVLESFQRLTKGLQTDRMVINKAGAKKYFQEQSSMVLMMIKDQKFVVVLEDASMEEEDDESLFEESSDEVDNFGQLVCEVQAPGGTIIKVIKADICQFKVDAVVNAANEDLNHIGGLALALLNAAGPSLQQISNQYIAKYGKLQPGNAITTEACKLPCKFVVHAVGPRFNSTGKSTAVQKLKQAVRESINQAESRECSSIAIPAISSGIFGFPLDLCAETIAQELYAYIRFKNQQGDMNRLKEINLVDKNPKTVSAMSQAVQKQFAEFKPRITFPHQMERGFGRGHSQSYQGHGNHGQGYHGQSSGKYQGGGARGDASRVYREKESEESATQTHLELNSQFRTQFEGGDRSGSGFLEAQSTKEGVKILLRKGNIQDAHSDAIVNTISEDLDLSKGAVSKALLNAAGRQLQTELDSFRSTLGSSRLNHGDIVDTKGYNLNCKMVFHTVCPFWNGGHRSEVDILREIIQNCLKKAVKQRMTSISFPAIGTGNLGFPKDLVSGIFLNEIHAFSGSVSLQFLKEVVVIVHPSDSQTVQCFEKSFRGEGKTTSRKATHTVQQSPVKVSSLAKAPQSSGSFFGAVSTPSLGVHQMRIGNLTLEVSSGDITKEKCDAIINSSNQTFNLKAGVSKAILDAAGSIVETECALALMSQQTNMIITSGGQLPCQKIIHIIGRNNPSHIKDVVYSALKLCEGQKFSSVAFPALGTGQGGVSPTAVADAMIEAVIDFVKKRKAIHLQSVKFLIFQPHMVHDFHQNMLKRQQENVEEQGGVMGWVKDTFDAVTNFFSGNSNAKTSINEEFEFVGEEFEPVVFQLCGESEEVLQEARNLITSFFVREQFKLLIKDSAINSFGHEEAEMLSHLQRELSVSIHLSKNGPEPEFTIEGLTRDVMKAVEQIRDMIRKVEKKIARKRDAFILSSQIEWQYQDHHGSLVPFDILTNYDLEEAFQLKLPRLKISINKEEYEADIVRGVVRGKYGQLEIKRTDLNNVDVSLPSNWKGMAGKLVLLVEIKQTSQEYKDVESMFRKTGLTSNIIKIERVQNETLWKNYMNQKAYFDKKNQHTNNEKLLFHGTGSDNIDKINERGFNRSYAGMHGAMYGNGVYFAVDPSYSAQGYAKPDAQGLKRMYLTRVLVGDFTVGKSGLLAPPAKNSTGIDQYDSVTDNRTPPSMFVIFHDVQAYPEHLITFK